MGQSVPKPGLRPFLPADLTGEDYTEAQQEAWIAALEETDLAERLGKQLTLIATLRDAPVGFASLKDNSHIDLLYVHPAAVRQGVAASLCDALEKLAGARGADKLTADVSDTAQPFFARRGYFAQRRNTVPLGDEWLGNTTMQKTLGATPEGTIQ
jgi:putative acetyltransferase